MKFGIIKERKNPPDRRVVFTPAELARMQKEHPDLKIKVEHSAGVKTTLLSGGFFLSLIIPNFIDLGYFLTGSNVLYNYNVFKTFFLKFKVLKNG